MEGGERRHVFTYSRLSLPGVDHANTRDLLFAQSKTGKVIKISVRDDLLAEVKVL